MRKIALHGPASGVGRLFAVAALGLAFAGPIPAGAAPAASGPVTVPHSQMRDVTARSGEVYRLFIWKPPLPAPEKGYPVLYVLDGNSVFGTLVDAIAFRSRAPQVTGVVPAIVVAIGYPVEEPFDMRRRSYDLTPPADPGTMPPRPNGAPWPPLGGADEFLHFIESEVKPLIAADFAVDRDREVLMGHSFGGLFALHALFARPGAFDAYVAGSPSIWFGDRLLLAEADAFIARQGEKPLEAALFIGVGGYEETLSPAETLGPDSESRRAWKAKNRMLGNARDMAEKLKPLEENGLRLSFVEFQGEDHSSVLPALVSRALGFALAPERSQ